MATSINGWTVLDNPAWGDPRLRMDIVPGVGTTLWVRDECWPLLAAIVADYNARIRKVTVSDGYDYRQANAANAWSDHSSGTAVDINYDAEGAQGPDNRPWWEKARRAVRAANIKRRYRIVIWGGAADMGGDYHQPGNWDWMHWALAKGTTVADVRRECRRLRIGPDGIRRRRDGSPVHPAA